MVVFDVSFGEREREREKVYNIHVYPGGNHMSSSLVSIMEIAPVFATNKFWRMVQE